jgi:hypothetical protein
LTFLTNELFYATARGSTGITRAFSSSNPARQYIRRLIALSRLIRPSTGPLLHGVSIASSTAQRLSDYFGSIRTEKGDS